MANKQTTVKIRQVEFGDAPTSCFEGVQDQDTAHHFFFVFTDPDSGELVCDYNTDADACFQKTVTIACDADTNQASVELFIRDETYSGQEKVDNPKIGICLSKQTQLGKSCS
jgi:hypothetical protein